MSRRLLAGLALALFGLAMPAKADSAYSAPDASPLLSPDARDEANGLGTEDNPDASALLNGRQPSARLSGPGFQKACSAKFSVSQNTLQNTTFGSPSWAGTSTGGPAVPTLVANNAQAADGTLTASTLTIPAVTAANSFSLFSEIFNGINATDSLTAVIEANNPSGNSPVWFVQSSFFAAANHYVSQIIPGDGAWHKVVVQLPGFGTSGNLGFSVGVDLRDSGESASAGTKNVLIRHPSLWVGAHTEVYNFIPNTTQSATAAVIQTLPCPPGIAFRDYSRLTPWPIPPVQANGIFPTTGAFLTWNSANTWEAGGVSNPIITSTVKVNGITYGWAAGTTAGNTNYQSLGLFQSTSPGNWTEVATGATNGGSTFAGNPVFTSNGGTFNHFLLHGWFGKCSTGTFCTYFSAAPSSADSSSAVFLSTASNILGPWSTPTIVIAGSVQDSIGSANPSLPSIVDVGGTQYMYTSRQTNGIGQTLTNYFTSPDTDGVNWTWRGIGLPPPISGNWDAARTGIQDPDVFQNDCKFFEQYYTINTTFQGFYQQIGVAISPWPTGPWWTSPASIFPLFPPLELTAWYATRGQTDAFLGTSAVNVVNGTFYYTATASPGNFATLANGVGVQATMPDACAAH